MKTKKQIAQELREGKVLVNLIVDSFKDDEKVKLLNTEKITKSEFIEQIMSDDPYDIIELYEGKYQVMNKKVKLPPETFIDPEKIKNLDIYYDLIAKIYPELAEYVKYVREKIKEGCAGCNKTSFSFKVLHAMKVLGGLNRDVEELAPALGRIYVNKLRELKADKTINLELVLYGRQPIEANKKPVNINSKPIENVADMKESMYKQEMKQIEVKAPNNWIRQQCLTCTGKHISTAWALFKEYLTDKEKYSDNWWEVIGELVCGEHECINIEIALTIQIREERHKIEEDRNYIPDLTRFFKILDKLLTGG